MKLRSMFVVLLVMFMVIGCGSRRVKKEYSGEKTLFVGWMDLKADDYKKFGFETKKEWEDEIKNINIDGLQKYIVQYLGKNFTVIGAKQLGDTGPKNGYSVIFKNTLIQPYEIINTHACICDAATGKELKCFKIESSPVSTGWGSYSFGGRLYNAVYSVAYDIYYQFVE